MKLEQTFEVQAPLAQVWEALNDLERVAPCLPGAAITSHDEDGASSLVAWCHSDWRDEQDAAFLPAAGSLDFDALLALLALLDAEAARHREVIAALRRVTEMHDAPPCPCTPHAEARRVIAETERSEE